MESDIFTAVKNNNIQIVKQLIQNGQDETRNGIRLLDIAVDNNNTDMVRLLLENGADPNKETKYKSFAIFNSIQNDNFDITKLLIQYGADVNKEKRNRDGLLDEAIEYNNLDIIKLLIENGAKLKSNTIDKIENINILKLFPIKNETFELDKLNYFVEYNNTEYLIIFTISLSHEIRRMNVYYGNKEQEVLDIVKEYNIYNIYVNKKINKDLFNYLMCCCICLGLKHNFLSLDDDIHLLKLPYENFNRTEYKKVIDFTRYCECKNVVKTQKSRIKNFCRNGKEYLNDLINQLRSIDYNDENDSEDPELNNKLKFQIIVFKLWEYIYYNSSKNLYIDLNIFIQNYLNEYLDILFKQTNCYLCELTFELNHNKIVGPKPEKLLNLIKKCKSGKKILEISISATGLRHSNTIIIQNNVAYRYEPSDKNMGPMFNNHVDHLLNYYFDKIGIEYKGIYQYNCELKHEGLCKYMSTFNIFYDNMTDSQLSKTIIGFFDWLINKRLCGTDWKSIFRRIKN